MLSFPIFQRLVVAAFGFDDFTCVRVFLDFHLVRLTAARLGIYCWRDGQLADRAS
jgi:hypothetical protein